MYSSLMISSLTSSSQFVKLLFWEGKSCHLYWHWPSYSFHVVIFQIDVSWSHWDSVLACSRFDFLGMVRYWIRIYGVRFFSLATFVILHHFSVWIRAFGYFWVSVVEVLWILVKWVSWGCCQTTFGIGWCNNFIFFGLSIAASEWRRGTFNLNFRLQLEQLH